MGIILSALAGAGDAGVQSENQNIDQMNKLDLMAQQNANELNKAKMLQDMQDAHRQQIADAVNAKAQSLANARQGIVASKTASNSGLDDPSNVGADENVGTDVQTAGQPPAQITDDDRMSAAKSMGLIDYNTLATNINKYEMAGLRAESAAARIEMMGKVAEIGAQSRVDAANLRVQAAEERAANGKIDTATGRMLITSEDANIRASTAQINMLYRELMDAQPKEKDGIQAQIEDLRAGIKTSQATKNAYMKQLGFPTSDDVAPAPTRAPAGPAPLTYDPKTGTFH